ncbi:similar to predicted gene ICRFP703B1614Q5.5, isoform CRA_a [Rattus norvegicus]|uniref:Similar to predicted gene ICRFP703B1614Q5.5, isoform CRA_a n=1 Tax=Rattus norvegicus TaxID=10116 RepID=A6I7Y6_RAT|nr:similar to predicted gene ICRFP703B1614Q5.5, isoform CRA_a [Rattus norvegicus]EDM17894.1 similar to predicted gene ICRFP703B1614Q5.5, isoform CRA_a [Rattus norvegicus]
MARQLRCLWTGSGGCPPQSGRRPWKDYKHLTPGTATVLVSGHLTALGWDPILDALHTGILWTLPFYALPASPVPAASFSVRAAALWWDLAGGLSPGPQSSQPENSQSQRSPQLSSCPYKVLKR